MDEHLAICACSGPTRRGFLADAGMGFVGLALGAMLHRDGVVRADGVPGWSPPDGKPHFPPRAKRVIWLMMRGGVSHLESFDPKPELTKHAGKTINESPHKQAVFGSPYLKNVREQVANNIIDKTKAKIYPTQIGFKKGGQSGIEVSDWWPHVREVRRRHRRDPVDVHDRQQPRRADWSSSPAGTCSTAASRRSARGSTTASGRLATTSRSSSRWVRRSNTSAWGPPTPTTSAPRTRA